MYNGELSTPKTSPQVVDRKDNESSEISVNTTNVTLRSKMSRSEALRISNIFLYQKLNQTINGKHFVFSNQNKANNKWWFEPKIETFENDLFIALNDDKLSKLYLFKIPGKELSPPNQHFKIRSDINKPSITIEGHDTVEFRDCSKEAAKVAFKKFLIATLEY